MDDRFRRRFREFEFDLTTRDLTRNGRPVPLERQPAIALATLLARPGRLVTRTELQHAIWPEGTHVDFGGGLNYCLRQVRTALGDDARSPVFIETIPRQGYRFVAPVSGPRAPSRRTLSAAAVLVTVLAAGFALDRLGGSDPAHHRVAVGVARAAHDLFF